MIRTAWTLGVLPEVMSADGADACTWIEVDVLAKSILEIAGISNPNSPPPSSSEEEEEVGEETNTDGQLNVFNLMNPRPFSWRRELLPKLKDAGLEFETVSWETWIRRVGEETDTKKNPTRKLLDFWGGGGGGSRVAELEKTVEHGNGNGDVLFDTNAAARNSPALARGGDERVVDGEMAIHCNV